MRVAQAGKRGVQISHHFKQALSAFFSQCTVDKFSGRHVSSVEVLDAEEALLVRTARRLLIGSSLRLTDHNGAHFPSVGSSAF
eukprot:1031261-Amphidinium_carterae.1